ncbi:hypothetical protein [Fimbriimonas ginsengisoli]|nr:hypothetical protein [Fimbriimonas ginsengisoli]
MVSTKCRELANLEGAEEFIREFLADSTGCSKAYDPHNHDFDLYLPWVFQCLQSIGVKGPLSLPELGVMLMDAAWSLSQKGYLRPGPRSVMGEDLKADGKGYSLTPLGRQWVLQR